MIYVDKGYWHLYYDRKTNVQIVFEYINRITKKLEKTQKNSLTNKILVGILLFVQKLSFITSEWS